MSVTSETKKAAKDATSMLKRPGFWVAAAVVAIVAVSLMSNVRVRAFFAGLVARVKAFVGRLFGRA